MRLNCLRKNFCYLRELARRRFRLGQRHCISASCLAEIQPDCFLSPNLEALWNLRRSNRLGTGRSGGVGPALCSWLSSRAWCHLFGRTFLRGCYLIVRLEPHYPANLATNWFTRPFCLQDTLLIQYFSFERIRLRSFGNCRSTLMCSFWFVGSLIHFWS